MSKTDNRERPAFITELTADVVAAYVTYNAVPVSEIPATIALVHAAFGRLQSTTSRSEEAPAEKPTPAIAIKRSVTDDHLVCLEDGKMFTSLKRHLMASHGLTPHEYRERWGLAADYPMVAPGYAEKRSKMAKKLGLGRKPGKRK